MIFINELNEVLKLDELFISRYCNISINDDNIDELFNQVESYDSKRASLIKSIDMKKIQKTLSNESIQTYIHILENNQKKSKLIFELIQKFYLSKISKIFKDKKLGIYSAEYNYTESNFFDIIKEGYDV